MNSVASGSENTTDKIAGEYVVVGAVQGHYGVKGWIKVLSFTRPALEILDFHHWSFVRPRDGSRSLRQGGRQAAADTVATCDETLAVLEGRWQGKGLIARLEGLSSRETAERLIGATIVVHRDQFAQAGDGEFYWSDLIGLRVRNQQNHEFGTVDHLVETGANDVLVVHKPDENGVVEETLIPWADQFVLNVDLEVGEMLVDWDAD